MSTLNASFFSGMTSVTVHVVGQNRRLRRLTLIVLVPWRTGPNAFIMRHCGLHCGIRLRSETNVHTLATGASMSICACNSGAAMESSLVEFS